MNWILLTGLVFIFLQISCIGNNPNTTNVEMLNLQDSHSISPPKKWNLKAFPLPVYIDPSFSGTEIENLELTLIEWNNSSKRLQFFNEKLKPTNKLNTPNLQNYKDNIIGIYRVNDWFAEQPATALAITQYFAKRKYAGTPYEYLEIFHADIILNNQNYNFSIYPNEEDDDYIDVYDLPSVILHELGHVLGLPHEHDPQIPSVMLPTLSTGQENRYLFYQDESNINKLYPSKNIKNHKLQFIPDTHKKEEIIRGIIQIFPNILR